MDLHDEDAGRFSEVGHKLAFMHQFTCAKRAVLRHMPIYVSPAKIHGQLGDRAGLYMLVLSHYRRQVQK